MGIIKRISILLIDVILLFACGHSQPKSTNLSKTKPQIQKFDTTELKYLIYYSHSVPIVAGSVVMVSREQDKNEDSLLVSARNRLRKMTTIESDLFALSSPESDVRSWGLQGVLNLKHSKQLSEEMFHNQFEKRIKELAMDDMHSQIRGTAIRALGNEKFIDSLKEKETDLKNLIDMYEPWYFNPYYTKTNINAPPFYDRICEIINGESNSKRDYLLSDMEFSIWNPSTAPMYQIQPDSTLMKCLGKLRNSKSDYESKVADKIYDMLSKKKK